MKNFAIVANLVLFTVGASAQSLPPPSRTVYKCEVAGKVHYSDSPCIGAKKIEVEPTRGLNKSSGKERIGQDVQREKFREGFAEAIKPVTGLDAKQLDRAGRRMKLSPEAQRVCQRLDRELPAAEQAESRATGTGELRRAQEAVFAVRGMFRSTGCE